MLLSNTRALMDQAGAIGPFDPFQPQIMDAQGLPRALTAADIQRGGFALNPATGQYEQVYGKFGPVTQMRPEIDPETLSPTGRMVPFVDDPDKMDWTDFSFDPTGRKSLTGWAPGYYSDNGGGLTDVLKNLATPANLFFAGTTGLGGMTLANAATGGDVGQGAAMDLAGLAAGYGLSSALPALGLSTPAAGLAAAGTEGLLGAEAANVAGGLKVAPEAASLGSAIQGASTAGGASGLAAGTTASGIGGGAAGTGLTGVLSNSALAPGVFASEATPLSLLGAGVGTGALGADVAANAAASAAAPSAAATAAATAAGTGLGTKIGDLLNGKVSLEDLLNNATVGDVGRVLGTGAATVGSYLANKEIADKYDALAREYMGFGAPSRQRYEASFAPGFDITAADPALKSAIDASTDALLRRGSVGGNPYGNPGVLSEINKYVTQNVALPYLSNYRNQNAATGGYGAFSTAAPGAASGSIGATGAGYNDIARGLGNILNPPSSVEDVMKQMRGFGGIGGLGGFGGFGVKGLT